MTTNPPAGDDIYRLTDPEVEPSAPTDHAAIARKYLGDGSHVQGQGYTSLHETQVANRLAGIGHALLAIHDAMTRDA